MAQLKLKDKLEEIFFAVNSDNVIIFNPNKDDSLPLNYTVNCFFEIHDLTAVAELIEKLKLIDNRQLFYEPEWLHITLLGEIDIKTDKNEIIEVVQSFLDENSIEFELLGVGSSRKVSSITAFPVDFRIENLRSQLRELGGGSHLDGPYEQLCWINLMRFLQKPKPELLETLKKEINTNFGKIKPKSIQLLKNSSRTLKNKQVIHEFVL